MKECKIAEKLIRLRLAKGVTQDEVAQRLSVSNKTVSKWETGVSQPELSMLVELSEYFGVTTDALLGLSDDKPDGTDETVRSMLAGLDWKDSVLEAFALEKAVIPALFDAVRKNETNITGNVYPENYSRAYRSQISTSDFFQFAASSEDVNLSVTLLRNKNNFTWLKDPEKQRKTVCLFRFLSEEDALSVLYFLHSMDCTNAFTSDYVSENTGIPADRVSTILKQLCTVGECNSCPAHLAEGEVDIYECSGDGILLSIVSLAYDRMCGKPVYDYNFNGGCKMIGGK